MNIKPFGKWNESVLSAEEQLKRIAGAAFINNCDVTINGEKAQIKGSEAIPYTVTLDSCTCRDFSTRKLPCKHIFYLAINAGYIDSETVEKCKHKYPVSPTKRETGKNSEEAMTELEKLDGDLQRALFNYLYEYIYHHAEFQKVEDSMVGKLRECPLVEISEAVFPIKIKYMRKNDVSKAIKELGKKIPASVKKDELPDWCRENAPELANNLPTIYHLTFAPQYKSAHRKMYSYLIGKFRENNYFE